MAAIRRTFLCDSSLTLHHATLCDSSHARHVWTDIAFGFSYNNSTEQFEFECEKNWCAPVFLLGPSLFLLVPIYRYSLAHSRSDSSEWPSAVGRVDFFWRATESWKFYWTQWQYLELESGTIMSDDDIYSVYGYTGPLHHHVCLIIDSQAACYLFHLPIEGSVT